MLNDRLIPTNGASDIVTFQVKIEGNLIPATHQVLSILVLKEVNRVPFAKIKIIDGDASLEDFPISNEDIFAPGQEVEILAGYQAEEESIFKGIIIKHGIRVRTDGQSILKLECRDKVFRSTLGRHNRYFTAITDSEAIDEINGQL